MAKYGHQLAEDQLVAFDRRGDQLLHRAALPFAGDGQRGEHGRDDHHDHGDQPGNDVVPRFQVLVEPDPRPHVQRDLHARPPRALAVARRSCPANRFRRSPRRSRWRWWPCSSRCRRRSVARGASRPASNCLGEIAGNHQAPPWPRRCRSPGPGRGSCRRHVRQREIRASRRSG